MNNTLTKNTKPELNFITCNDLPSSSPNNSSISTATTSQRRLAYWEWNTDNLAHADQLVICVHGLTRQGRDFDILAQDLSQNFRVICPDIAGRGESDKLADPQNYALPQYVADMLTLIQTLYEQSLHTGKTIKTIHWVGTSMGGLIGIALAGNPHLPLAIPLGKLLLNDVAPRLEWASLERISAYTGLDPHFSSEAEAVAWLAEVSKSFGRHSEEEWLALSRPMLRRVDASASSDGGYKLHYDPKIAVPFRQLTPEIAAYNESLLWSLYDQINLPTLLLRGEESDLVSLATAEEMSQRGPKAECVTVKNVGHAPTLISEEQRQIVRQFLLS